MRQPKKTSPSSPPLAKNNEAVQTSLLHWESLSACLAEMAALHRCNILVATPEFISIEFGEKNILFKNAGNALNLLPSASTHVKSDGDWHVWVGSTVELDSAAVKSNQGQDQLFFLPAVKKQLEILFLAWLNHSTSELPSYSENVSATNIRNVLAIARELNGIRDIQKLLQLILEKALDVTTADAGSIYVVEQKPFEEKSITFKVSANRSREIKFTEFKLPVNTASIVGNCVLHRKTIHVPDLYKLSQDPTKNPFQISHDVSFDLRNHYECHSMVSIPMYDIGDSVIGVIQLINCKNTLNRLETSDDFRKFVIPFPAPSIEYAEIVAYQAGIALENAILTEEKVAMFDGFVDASVKAIEQRDPTTSGHSHRVSDYSLELADVVNRVTNGVYGNLFFSTNQLKELRYASMLHDFGKLGVREAVLVKSKKLYPWQELLIQERFELIRALTENRYLKELYQFSKSVDNYPPGVSEESFLARKKQRLEQLEKYYEFIVKANEPTILEKGGFEFLRDIAGHSFMDTQGKNRPYLDSEELDALSVSKGSLTASEFNEIQSHVVHTYEFLRKIPWGRDLANIPEIAAKHHEKLDGSGYPHSVPAEDIPTQSRIIAIADIFDALTASDRPYKKSVPVERALDILAIEVKAGKCDGELFKLFVEAKCWERCTHKTLGVHSPLCSEHKAAS